jgi:hypothetical protein
MRQHRNPHFLLHYRLLLMAGFIAAMSVAAIQAEAQQRPYRGPIPWAFIVCQYAGDPAPNMTNVKNLTINSGTQGLADYVKAMSNGIASLAGSTVAGPFQQTNTAAQETAIDHSSPTGYQTVLTDCLTAAANSSLHYTPPASHYYVLTSSQLELKGWENSHALGAVSTPLSEIAHEFGHGVGLEHSWSNDTAWSGCGGPAAPNGGDYGDTWDTMAAACNYSAPGPFVNAPSYFAAHHLDEMGWIPQSRAVTFGYTGATSGTITLAALSHPEVAGTMLLRVPFDSSDPHHYYTVEFRKKDGWDTAIPADIVLISEIKNNGGYYQVTLQRDIQSPYGGTNSGAPLQTLSANGVTIKVGAISGNQAIVTVTSNFAKGTGHGNPAQSVYGPNTCAKGYVWRSADDSDYVCVTPATRTQASADNAAASSRKQSGSSNCKQGYVWREAFPGDLVCVTPATRTQAGQDNAQANARLENPNA